LPKFSSSGWTEIAATGSRLDRNCGYGFAAAANSGYGLALDDHAVRVPGGMVIRSTMM